MTTTVISDLRGKRWDLIETVGVPISVSVTATDPDGQPITYPGVIAFRVFTTGDPIQTEATVVGNVASGTILTGQQSKDLGSTTRRWAMVDTQTGDEFIAGHITLSDPGVGRSEATAATDVAVLVGPNDVTLTGVIVAQTVETGGGGATDPEVVRDTVATFLQPGTDVEITHNDVANTLAIAIPNVVDHMADSRVHITDSNNFTEGDIVVWDGTGWVRSPNRADSVFADVTAGVTLAAGVVVTVTGWMAGRPVIAPCTTNDVPYGMTFEPISINDRGSILTSGLIEGLNTSAWPINTHLWVDFQAAGALSDFPVPGAHAVALVVEQANNGTIRVLPHTDQALPEEVQILQSRADETDDTLADIGSLLETVDADLAATNANVGFLTSQVNENTAKIPNVIYNSATGRRTEDGIETGSTGERDILSLVGNGFAPQIVRLIRTGYQVEMLVQAQPTFDDAKQGNVMLTLPSGFRPRPPYMEVAHPRAAAQCMGLRNTGSVEWPFTVTQATYMLVKWTTADPWPADPLPGVQVTAPYQKPA